MGVEIVIRRGCKNGRRNWNFKSSLLELTLLYLCFQMFGRDFHIAMHMLYMVECSRVFMQKMLLEIGMYLLLAMTEVF